MSSSSIEVMSGDDVQMVLMGSDDVGLEERKPQLHTLTAAEPITYVMGNQDEQQEMDDGMEAEEAEMEDYDHLEATAGSIIFSPQDLMSLQRDKTSRGRGRGRGTRALKRTDALTIKLEEGGDYSRINVPVSCEICGKIVANGKTLVQHMTTHSDVKPFQCPHCPNSFSRMVHLQGHLVLHGIEKQFECPICHQRFSRQDCVKVHMRLHDKSKCVFCDVCHKAFLTLGALNIHMRIHRGEKPFKCHLCGKCFTQKNHVITHIKRHTKVLDAPFSKKLGPRMFQCEHCPRSFIRLSDYERHVQWNHGAVAETNMSEKLLTMGTASEGEKLANSLSSEFIIPAETLNIKVKKRGFRKVMCTIGTQTDEEGGHVIIPRQYQSSTSMTTASTQVSAPPTPRAAEEEIYENDIFDEGMDRNYSSDEEEIQELEENDRNVTYQECETITSYTQDGASTSANDDAFDAVIGKTKPQLVKNEEKPKLVDPKCPNNDFEKINHQSKEGNKIQYELGTEYSKRDEAFFQVQPTNNAEPTNEVTSKDYPHVGSNDNYAVDAQIRKPVIAAGQRHTKIMENFNTKNWKGRGRGRGRGRGKSKGIMGLTGATHLRLIRKSMMNFISEKTEVATGKNVGKSEKNETPDISGDIRVKRQARSKQHGKDFVCSSKSCETCNPQLQKDPKDNYVDKVASVEDPETSISVEENCSSITSAPVKDQSQKLLQFLISGDETNLQGTDFKLICDVKVHEEAKRQKNEFISNFGFQSYEKTKAGKSMSSYSGDNISHSLNQSEKRDFFTPSTTSTGDIISPPVELQAFCIPTYSCKLCGREFRFEGKLHRHIESVHQKKAIFSPDVKPGRGSTRFMERDSPLAVEPKEELLIRKKPTPQNPEIEALRSEWDDDENDDNDEYEEDEMVADERISHPQSIGHIAINRPIVTREIAPVTGTITDVFVSGVKVNINKLSGLAGNDILEFARRNQNIAGMSPSRQDITKQPAVNTKQQEKVVNSLDVKCRKLLEKLFDHNLLIECGLFEEHVSVVLGRLLQHYGVKMIEDYGQGQYEVLKYNLWRLIEWKVTMEQMEEFYTEGKSVEEMMDDIMNGRVPIIAHHEPQQAQMQEQPNPTQHNANEQISSVETVHISDNQIMLSQVANVFSGQLNLGDGVTQVVLAQDVSPELLQGAHIVTIDPTTGQVISQVTADQVILAESMGEELSQQIQQSMDGHIVVSHSSAPSTTVVTSLPPGSILASHNHNSNNVQVSNEHIDTQQVLSDGTGTIIKMEETHSIRRSQ